MSINVPRGQTDDVLRRIQDALQAYQAAHPHAEIDLYRQNSVSVRVRIVDADFAKLDKQQRNDSVWRIFDTLTDDEQSEISMLLLLTPDEKPGSFANFEFDDPVPSRL